MSVAARACPRPVVALRSDSRPEVLATRNTRIAESCSCASRLLGGGVDASSDPRCPSHAPAIARGATDDLVRALDRAGVGYTRLARASRRGNEPAYAEARRMILGAEDAVRVAREQLRAHGY